MRASICSRRWTNNPDVATWRRALGQGALPPRTHEELSARTRARERLMLAARNGIALPFGEVEDYVGRNFFTESGRAIARRELQRAGGKV